MDIGTISFSGFLELSSTLKVIFSLKLRNLMNGVLFCATRNDHEVMDAVAR
jgi:hypothetical protein